MRDDWFNAQAQAWQQRPNPSSLGDQVDHAIGERHASGEKDNLEEHRLTGRPLRTKIGEWLDKTRTYFEVNTSTRRARTQHRPRHSRASRMSSASVASSRKRSKGWAALEGDLDDALTRAFFAAEKPLLPELFAFVEELERNPHSLATRKVKWLSPYAMTSLGRCGSGGDVP